MSLLPLLASFVMAGAGCMAIAAIASTLRAQLPAVRKVLADSRSISADREFLVAITEIRAVPPPRAVVRSRRVPVRVVRSAPVLSAEKPLRAAA